VPQCSADDNHRTGFFMDMDNLTLRYFDAEMRYLREAGKEFAEAFPDRAAHLNLDKPGAQDPYVERLFEGFAFLMGRLREKLDDDLPELTEGLVSLLWPHYLRTIPSLSIVELVPDLAQIKRSERIAKGFEILSQPIGPQRTRCRYTTTQDVTLQPLAVTCVERDHEPDGRSLLRLRFARSESVPWAQIDLSCLPLYLNADAPLASALHQADDVRAHGRAVWPPERGRPFRGQGVCRRRSAVAQGRQCLQRLSAAAGVFYVP
jgi:type VI secretion system protein ImpG